jgi:uncharacterized membrane protein YbhN (UPF0104 family)
MKIDSIKKFLPLLVSVAILGIVTIFVPWKDVAEGLKKLTWSNILILCLLSLVYYYGKVFRYWQMLRMLDMPMSFGRVTLAYFTAHPVALLPAGELYRTVMFKKYGNAPPERTSSIIVAQGLIEALALLIIALAGAITIKKGLLPIVALASVFGFIILSLKYSNLNKGHKLINKLPGVSLSRFKYRAFKDTHTELFHRYNFLKLLVSSYITTAAGIAILMESTSAVGARIDVYQAAIAYALPVILGAVSLLPGGLGANEQGQVGILALFGVGFTPAIIITLLLRSFTLGIGLVYGLVAILLSQVITLRTYD